MVEYCWRRSWLINDSLRLYWRRCWYGNGNLIRIGIGDGLAESDGAAWTGVEEGDFCYCDGVEK